LHGIEGIHTAAEVAIKRISIIFVCLFIVSGCATLHVAEQVGDAICNDEKTTRTTKDEAVDMFFEWAEWGTIILDTITSLPVP
jgi:hypothetical protein